MRNEWPCIRAHLCPGGTCGSQCAASSWKILKMSICCASSQPLSLGPVHSACQGGRSIDAFLDGRCMHNVYFCILCARPARENGDRDGAGCKTAVERGHTPEQQRRRDGGRRDPRY